MSTPSGKPFDPFDLSPYAPRRARERVASDQAATAAGPAAENDSYAGDRTAADLPSYAARAAQRLSPAGEHPAAPDGGDQAQSRSERDPTDGPMAAPAATVSDVDLARLESSLQWLQREGGVGRLPRAVQLPPVSGLRPVDPEGTRARSEQFINGVRVPPSLAPERLRPPPMRERRDHLRGPCGSCWRA